MGKNQRDTHGPRGLRALQWVDKLESGDRSKELHASGHRDAGPAQRCVEGAAPGPAAIGVETAVSVDATLSLHLGRTVSGCHVFIVTSS